MEKYDSMKLENQLCFPLYAASREVIKKYGPFLSAKDLTYTQYIALMLLWENKKMSVKEMGSRLFLDSGTLTPLLKSLEKKGYVSRRRSAEDERVLVVEISESGMALREELSAVPELVSRCSALSSEEAHTLYVLLYKILKRD